MGNSPGVTLDFSTFQPIQKAAASPGSNLVPSGKSRVTLDMSTFEPIGESAQGNQSPEKEGAALAGASQATSISPQPASTGWRDSLAHWSDNVMSDIKYGTDLTGVGTVLKRMGAHGVYNGNPEAVGDFMASLPLGLARATKGGAEITQSGKTWQGTKDIVGGAGQALTIPGAFMGGPAAETGATAAMNATGKIFGNVEHAGQLFNEVKTAAGGNPVEITDAMSQAAMRAKELQDAGAKGLPRVISKFVARVTDPDKAPIAWDEARDFYSNVSRLSANEYQSMNPQMAAQVGKFAGAFDDALRATAETAGKGDEYSQAMQLYHTSKVWQRFGSNLWEGFKRALPYAGAGAIGGAAGRRLSSLLEGQ
jgi:hypothetical protein